MFFGEICDSIRGKIDCRQKIKPKSDRLLVMCSPKRGTTIGLALPEVVTQKPHMFYFRVSENCRFAIAMPMQQADAQDALGGALLGGAAGAIVGGALGGGRGAAVGAIIGGTSGAIIAAQGQPRPGGYYYYRNGCYQRRPDGEHLAGHSWTRGAGAPRFGPKFRRGVRCFFRSSRALAAGIGWIAAAMGVAGRGCLPGANLGCAASPASAQCLVVQVWHAASCRGEPGGDGLVFVLTVVPMALLMRFLGKNILDIDPRARGERESYWISRTERTIDAESMRNQF